VIALPESWDAAGVLQTMLEEMADGVIAYDQDLRVLGINRAAERLLSVDANGAAGRPCRDVLRCPDCDSGCGILGGLDGTGRGSVHLHDPSGGQRVAIVATIPVHARDGSLAGAIATLRSVTESIRPARRYEVIAESDSMRQLIRFARRVAASEASTVLLDGESGTGKDLLARSIHGDSARAAGPFVAINCAASPETLIESELFGYEQGAFTDAKRSKPGLFELAHQGTLFLDEVGEIPLTLQAKLLRALEERTFRRLGGLKDVSVDVRVIAATNRNLREAVAEGAFRQDLYFRLNVINLTIPPLRDRPEDILPLAQFFVRQYNAKFKQQIEGLSADANQALLAHDWPGNVRELRNAIERAMILEDSGTIRRSSLPEFPRAHSRPDQSLAGQEKAWIEDALARAGGNQTQAARLLSITRDTLRYKVKKFGLGR
jgi:transcriptional regulator with PAS, ATPase and Fis domain